MALVAFAAVIRASLGFGLALEPVLAVRPCCLPPRRARGLVAPGFGGEVP